MHYTKVRGFGTFILTLMRSFVKCFFEKTVFLQNEIFENKNFEIIFEQLAIYFIFRHLADAMWDGDYASRVRFMLMSCYIIGALCVCFEKKNGSIGMDKIVDFVRMYSSEIEYSEENTEILMNYE